MGTIIPDPFEPPPADAGDPCSVCWGPGKTFGDVDTPEKIWVSFSGVNLSEDWLPINGDALEGLFELTQSIPQPCIFVAPPGPLVIQVWFSNLFTNVGAIHATEGIKFSGAPPDKCQTLIDNEIIIHFVGGTCKIYLEEPES